MDRSSPPRRRLGLAALVGIATVASLVLAQPAQAATAPEVDTAFATAIGSGFNGAVMDSVEQPDGKIIVVGHFTEVSGVASGRIARLNPDGSLDSDFTNNLGLGLDNIAYTVALQPDGKIIVGGLFTTFDGESAVRVVRLNADGTWDGDFQTDIEDVVNQSVNAIAVQSDGKILLGGSFGSVEGTSSPGLARVNEDGSLDTTFSATIGAGFLHVRGDGVESLAVQSDGAILVGGYFAAANTTPTNNLARLNADGTVDADFITNLGLGFVGDVGSLVVQSDGTILAGGSFAGVNGDFGTSGVARLSAEGIVDTGFAVDIGPYVLNIAVQDDGMIVAVGQFTTVGPFDCLGVVRLGTDASIDEAFCAAVGTGAAGYVRALTVQADGGIIVGGQFADFDGVVSTNLARLAAVTPTPTSSPSASPTSTASPTATPTATASPTSSATPSSSPSPTSTASLTSSSSSTSTDELAETGSEGAVPLSVFAAVAVILGVTTTIVAGPRRRAARR